MADGRQASARFFEMIAEEFLFINILIKFLYYLNLCIFVHLYHQSFINDHYFYCFFLLSELREEPNHEMINTYFKMKIELKKNEESILDT